MRQTLSIYRDQLSKYTLTTLHIILNIRNDDRVCYFATFKAVNLVCLEIGIVNSPFWKGAPHLRGSLAIQNDGLGSKMANSDFLTI